MRVEPFAKMIKLETQPTEKESTPPVKYRRNLFDGGKTKYDEVTFFCFVLHLRISKYSLFLSVWGWGG